MLSLNVGFLNISNAILLFIENITTIVVTFDKSMGVAVYRASKRCSSFSRRFLLVYLSKWKNQRFGSAASNTPTATAALSIAISRSSGISGPLTNSDPNLILVM